MYLIHRYLTNTLGLTVLMVASFANNASAVTFTPPSSNGAPSQATGGASRSSIFVPAAGNGVPRQATGGASRSNLFAPAPGQGSPSQATGGASRTDLFNPVPENGSPSQAGSGSSRGELFAPTPGNGSPSQAGSGASRAGDEFPAAIIALLPQTFYGTTVFDRPRILVYLPASNAQEAVFSLKDEAGNMQYQMTIPTTGKAGVVAIDLPIDAPALEVGKNYQWFLALKLDGQLEPRTPYVDGWIQRVPLSDELVNTMKQSDPLQRSIALGKEGVWYDCLAILAKLYADQPTNPTLAKHWSELLSSVGLTEIQAVPVLSATY